MFELHPQLAKDCIPVGDFPLSRLLMMDDAQFPWFILVPRREGVTEMFQLDEADQMQLHRELMSFAQALQDAFAADKMNIAALGNMVSQLHVHVIARYRKDPAWPAPVWGKLPAVPCDADTRKWRLDKLRTVLTNDFNFAEANI